MLLRAGGSGQGRQEDGTESGRKPAFAGQPVRRREPAAGRAGDKITVRLDLYDNTVNSTNENAHWKKSYQGTFTINSGATYFVIKPRDFKFVKGRTPKARLKFSAPSSNRGSVDVIYP